MNPESANSTQDFELSHPAPNKSEVKAAARCAFSSTRGRRCRMPSMPETFPFCPQHSAYQPQDLDSINLAPALLGKLKELHTASDMQRVLGKLFILLAQNRVTTKKAAVLTYIIQQLLRTLPEVEHELNSQSGADPAASPILIDLPRPDRTLTASRSHEKPTASRSPVKQTRPAGSLRSTGGAVYEGGSASAEGAIR